MSTSPRCPSCLHAFDAVRPLPMTCPACGKEVAPGLPPVPRFVPMPPPLVQPVVENAPATVGTLRPNLPPPPPKSSTPPPLTCGEVSNRAEEPERLATLHSAPYPTRTPAASSRIPVVVVALACGMLGAVLAKVPTLMVPPASLPPSVVVTTLQDVPPLLARDRLVAALHSEGEPRRQTAHLLGEIAGRLDEMLPELLPMLADPSPEIRRTTVETLGRMGPLARVAQPRLMALSQHDTDDAVRAASTQASDAIGRPTQADLPRLLRALEAGSPTQRLMAAEALLHVPLGPSARPMLVKALEDREPRLRLLAAHLLWSLDRKAEVVLPVVLALLDSRDMVLRGEAVVLVARLAMVHGAAVRPAIPALIAQLAGSDERFLLPVVQALGAIGPEAKAALSALEPHLQSGSGSLRLAVAIARWCISGDAEKAFPVVMAGLVDRDPALAVAAVEALRLRGRAAVVFLPTLRQLREDVRPAVRSAVATALLEIPPPDQEALPGLVDGLRSVNLFYRRECLRALALMDRDSQMALPHLPELLRQGDESQRLAVLQVVETIGAPAARLVPDLVALLVEESSAQRGGVLRALAAIGPEAKAALPTLLELLRESDVPTQAQALECLGALRKEARGHVGEMAAFLKHEDARLRGSAAWALARLGSESRDAVKPLVEALEDADARVRLYAAQAVHAITLQSKVVQPVLLRCLKEEPPAIRAAAVETLAAITTTTDETVLAAVTPLLRDHDDGVRRAAGAALRKLDPRYRRPQLR